MFSGAFRLDTQWLRRYIRETFSAGGELRQSVRHPAARSCRRPSAFASCSAPASMKEAQTLPLTTVRC